MNDCIDIKKAFTLPEIMLALAIISIVCLFIIREVNLARVHYLNNFFSYSAFTNTKNATTLIYNEGCTTDDITNGICDAPGGTLIKILPKLANPPSAPSRGFCSRFADQFNVLGDVDCSTASAVDPSETEFAGLIPNFTTSNGMRFYNFNSDPVGGIYSVYVDIDGSQRDGKINEDVLKFNIKIDDGSVLPDITSIAATNREYLSASVKYYNGGFKWIYGVTNPTGVDDVYNVSYLAAECAINGNYSGDSSICATTQSGPAYTKICSNTANLCQIVLNKPSFFLLGFASAGR